MGESIRIKPGNWKVFTIFLAQNPSIRILAAKLLKIGRLALQLLKISRLASQLLKILTQNRTYTVKAH